MKKAFASVLFVFAFSFSFSQTFSLTDTALKVGSYYRTYNMHFHLGKAELLPQCFPHIDSIVLFLSNNPTVKLEISYHSDSRSCKQQEIMSSKLYEARAQSIANYFVSKGIDANRFVSKGYGCAKLLIKDVELGKLKTLEEIEAAHQKNRRVEFTIIAI